VEKENAHTFLLAKPQQLLDIFNPAKQQHAILPKSKENQKKLHHAAFFHKIAIIQEKNHLIKTLALQAKASKKGKELVLMTFS